MTPTSDLLVELLVEELPPKALRTLGEAFASALAEGLATQGLRAPDGAVTPYATPRRLAVLLAGVAARASDQAVSHKLMPVAVGLDAQGQATPALLKKLAGLGADASAVPSLKRAVDGKAEALFLATTVRGATLAEGLQKALGAALAKLPIPKVMSYQLADGWSSVKFVRPAHGLVALHGSQVLPCSVLGLDAGNTTQGHRFEAKASPITLRSAAGYAEQLQTEGAVVASFAQRRALIEQQLAAAAAREGLACPLDEALLDEVTALVERPNVLAGGFDAAFLTVPPECLTLTMKANQKYFPLLDSAGKLAPRFLLVANVSPADPRAVIEGNERVVRPRLADAKFFYEQDLKKPLAERAAGLARVVYHGQLGSQAERSARVAAIAHAIVNQLRQATLPYTAQAKDDFEMLDAKVREAAALAKADLLTDMVGEFPELQGVMGGYYARAQGLRDGVAIAIEDHYKPRFAGDALPRNHTGTVLALADKFETLVGLFGIGQQPSGDKDPYALRRHALGVLRILIDKNLPLALPELVAEAARAFDGLLPDAGASNDKLLAFIYERLAGLLRDAHGATAQEADAVIAARPPWGHFPRRLAAVRAFAALPEATALAAANKRVGQILKKAEGDVPTDWQREHFTEPAEHALADALARVAPEAERLAAHSDETAALRALAALREPVDAFFDSVMVNAPDAALRANRLALLAHLHRVMNGVADLSRLA